MRERQRVISVVVSCCCHVASAFFLLHSTERSSVNIGSPFFRKGKYFQIFKFSLNLEPFFLLSRVTRDGTVVYFLLFNPPCDWETNNFSGRMISLRWGGRRDTNEKSRLAAYRFFLSHRRPHTRLSVRKGSKNNTLRWMAMAKEKTEKISERRDDNRLPYTMHSCCPPNFFWFFIFFICDLFLCLTYSVSGFLKRFSLLSAS